MNNTELRAMARETAMLVYRSQLATRFSTEGEVLAYCDETILAALQRVRDASLKSGREAGITDAIAAGVIVLGYTVLTPEKAEEILAVVRRSSPPVQP